MSEKPEEKLAENHTERWVRGENKWEIIESSKQLRVGDLVRIYVAGMEAYIEDQHGFQFHIIAQSIPDEQNPDLMHVTFKPIQMVVSSMN